MRIGIDLGGTKIEGILLDGAGAERWRERVPTPAGDYDGTLAAIVALVRAGDAAAGERCTVGIGTPGALSMRTGLLRNANSVVLNGRPLRADLQARLGRPVRMENDANCFAMSEATDGAAAGARSVFGVILGTGVGGGLVIDGRLHGGAQAIAGEWGHVPLPPADQLPPGQWLAGLDPASERPGPDCYCGRRGCVETWLSGPGFARDARHRDAQAAIAAMRAGEPSAAAAFERYVDRLARALAGVVNVLDPEAIVLGGGLSNVDELYDRVPQRWGAYVFSDGVSTRLLRNRHGDSSGVRGAAWL